MVQLNLGSVTTCILAAYNQYLAGIAGNIIVPTPQGNITVTCIINTGRFNCGFPGYYMAAADIPALKAWCINHPGADRPGGPVWGFGFRGLDPTHPSTVNVTLIDRTPLMFNFHVNIQ